MNRHSMLQNQTGLTLIEMMIGLTLGIVLLLAVSSVFVSGSNAYNNAQRFIGLQSDLSYINDMILVDTRGATNVTTANNGTELRLTTAAGVVFYQRNSNGELLRQLNANPAVLVAENINLFQVNCLNSLGAAVICANAVQIETTLELTTIGSQEDLQHRISFRAALRNAVLNLKFPPAAGA